MARTEHTTSTTGVTLGPGVANGVTFGGTTAGAVAVRLHNAASTTGTGTLLATIDVPETGTGYLSLGGLGFTTNTLVASTAAYGGVTVMYQ